MFSTQPALLHIVFQLASRLSTLTLVSPCGTAAMQRHADAQERQDSSDSRPQKRPSRSCPRWCRKKQETPERLAPKRGLAPAKRNELGPLRAAVTWMACCTAGCLCLCVWGAAHADNALERVCLRLHGPFASCGVVHCIWHSVQTLIPPVKLMMQIYVVLRLKGH